MGIRNGRQGVLLAAGHATRLGLKGLLPQRDGQGSKLIMDSGLDLLCTNCDDVLILDTPHGLLQHVGLWDQCGGTKVRINTDPRSQGGILEALVVGAANSNNDEIMVAHWDNIYPYEYYPWFISHIWPGCAVVREVPLTWTKRLDGRKPFQWAENQNHKVRAPHWVQRGNDATMALTTPWFFTRETALRASRHNSLIEFLNGENVAPLEMDLGNWCDIGTEEAYIAYIQNRTI